MAVNVPESKVFFEACLENPSCAHLFGQQAVTNYTRFVSIATALVPGWPRDSVKVIADMQNTKTALQSFLIASACSEECGFNQQRSGNTCVALVVGQARSSIFVNILFVVSIVVALLATAVYVSRNYKELRKPNEE